MSQRDCLLLSLTETGKGKEREKNGKTEPSQFNIWILVLQSLKILAT